MKANNELPDLAVIDLAMKFIKDGKCRFTCIALQRAIIEVHRFDWLYEERRSHQSKLIQQYRMCTSKMNGGELPTWWNNYGRHRRERLAALRRFRKACVNAGKGKFLK